MSIPTRLVSHEKPIEDTEFGPIPQEWYNSRGEPLRKNKREIAKEEAARDMAKSPDQILADIHDESLDAERHFGLTIARSLARLASLQLRVERDADRLNTKVFWFGVIGVVLSVASVLVSSFQLWLEYTKGR